MNALKKIKFAQMKYGILITFFVLAWFPVSKAQNPIIRDIFTADPAPLVYNDTLYLYTWHDVAPVNAPNYEMADWHLFSTTDMVHWKDYGAVLSPKTFSWADKDAYAAQCIYHK